jgi:hypothetical protein
MGTLDIPSSPANEVLFLRPCFRIGGGLFFVKSSGPLERTNFFPLAVATFVKNPKTNEELRQELCQPFRISGSCAFLAI